MKYIRTKDNIYEVYKETEDGYIINAKPFLETTKTAYYLNLFFSKERVIKAANTIEELCDEFVLLDKELNHRHIVISSKGFMPSKDYELYGAIWTDKGLIYVAKMNEKGELELL